MASSFERWEKDPFFSAAEEVQESADRMESSYRTWIHAKKDSSGIWDLNELRRDLQTNLGTTKWQLDEFERAVKSSYSNSSSADDSRDRHRDFIVAIESQIKRVECSLNESTTKQGKPPLPWVRLDEGERDELALFLSGPSLSEKPKIRGHHSRDRGSQNSKELDRQSITGCSRSSVQGQEEPKEEKLSGHRRTASAGADIGSWKITVSDDSISQESSGVQHDKPPRKIPSLSGFLNTMELSMSQLKLSKLGYKKLKVVDRHQEVDAILPRSQNLTRGVNVCYEKSKSRTDSCDDCYDKQLYGWYGSIQRQFQRSQYHMQYSRPVQIVFSSVIVVCLLVVLVFRVI